MTKLNLTILALMLTFLLCMPAHANLLVNGDFESGLTGWTFWKAGWGNGESATVQSSVVHEGIRALKLSITEGRGSFGVYQEVPVTPGEDYQATGWWKGQFSGGTNWFEVILLDGRFNLAQVDDPNICPDNFAAAYDPAPAQFDWEPISAAYVTTVYIEDGIRTATSDYMTVVLKTGGFGQPNGYYDEMGLHVVPEPSSLVALSGGAFVLAGAIRRRRRQ